MSERPHGAPEDAPEDQAPPITPPVTPRQRWRDRVWSLRALIAVALASVIVGGLAGAALATASNHEGGRDRFGPGFGRHGGFAPGRRRGFGPGSGFVPPGQQGRLPGQQGQVPASPTPSG